MVVMPIFNADSIVRSLLTSSLNIVGFPQLTEPPLPPWPLTDAEKKAIKERDDAERQRQELEEILKQQQEQSIWSSSTMTTTALILLAIVALAALWHYTKYGHLYLGRLFVPVREFQAVIEGPPYYFPEEDPSTSTLTGQEGAGGWQGGTFPVYPQQQLYPPEQAYLPGEQPPSRKKNKKRKRSLSLQQQPMPQYHYAPPGTF